MEATFSPPPPSTSSPPPLPVSYTTFPFSLMQTDYVISRFIQVATTFACLFFFSPSVLPSFFLFYFFVAASFCFAKLIQPDSPAAFNQRDDLRFFFAVVGFPWILYPPPNFYTPTHASAVRSVFVLSRPVVLCKREGGSEGGKRRFNEGYEGDCCWCSSSGTIYFNDMVWCVFLWWLIGWKGNWKYGG